MKLLTRLLVIVLRRLVRAKHVQLVSVLTRLARAKHVSMLRSIVRALCSSVLRRLARLAKR